MATEAQIANLAKARAARAAKRATAKQGAPKPPPVGGVYDESVEALILTMKEQINVLGDKVEVLWLERDNALAARRLNDPYNITYRCTECGTLVEALHPKFRHSITQAVKCPNPVHSGGLTVMDYTP